MLIGMSPSIWGLFDENKASPLKDGDSAPKFKRFLGTC